MKIALAQLNYHTGNFEHNSQKIIEQIQQARANGVDLLVFAELALTGYPPRDFLEFRDFIDETNDHVKLIAKETQGICVILGVPVRNTLGYGKALFNSALLIADGMVQDRIDKSLLPNYDIFDEYRYFQPATSTHCIQVKGHRIALSICEDLWNVGEAKLYSSAPMEDLIGEKPDLIINIAASPFSRHHLEKRKEVLLENVKQYGLPLLYCNHVGAQTEIVFDGGSMAINGNGEVVDEMAYFDEEYKEYLFENGQLAQVSEDHSFLPEERVELVHDALVTGIRDYFKKLGFKQAILGSSGGIDSALVQALASKALGAENVRAILLPSRYSSDHSIADAEQLSKNLGNPYDTIEIEKAFNAFEELLSPQFSGTETDITEENMQSRSRGVILMALSNKFGYILLNTSNKSENAVGYGTLYGDMAGGLSVIGDLYKTEVYELARFMNRNEIVIPENILTKAPSAELRPDQKDSDSLPDYEVLDPLLYKYIEERKGPKELIELGFDEALVKRVLKLVNVNEYKRHQTAPILRVSSKAFGMGRRMPIVAKYLQ